jgi:hypothetical protein
VTIAQRLKSRAVTKRALLSLGLALGTLLVCALPAGAETNDGEIANQVSAAVAPAPAPEGSIPAEQPQSSVPAPQPQSPIPAEQPQPVPATPAPEPVEVANPGGSPDTAAESAPTVPPPGSSPASIQPSSSAASRSSLVSHLAPPTSVGVPTGTEPAKAIGAAVDRSSSAVQVPPAPRLTDGISPLVQTGTELAQSGTEGSLLVATEERALSVPPALSVPSIRTLERELLTPALESIAAPATVEALASPGTGPETFRGSPPATQGASPHSPPGLFSHQPSLFSSVHSIGFPWVGPIRRGASSSGDSWEKVQLSPQGRVTGAFSGGYLHATIDRLVSSYSPVPSRLPQPAPESPGGIEGGSGGSFFVPLVALLALLALVAPATLRRRLEAAAFPPPTQFVCALERPG